MRAAARRTAAVLLAAALLAAGCGSPEVPGAATDISAVAGEAAGGNSGAGDAPAGVPVSSTLAFSGKTLDGGEFDARTFAGRPAILWFWAPWCGTCASEAFSVGDLKTEYRDRLQILGIAGMGDTRAMKEFVTDFEVGHVPHIDDRAGTLWKRFKITQQSLYVLIDRTGKITYTGYLDDQQLTAQVRSMAA